MPTVAGNFTVNNGDIANAAYLNLLCQSVVTVSAASVLLGNPTASTSQAWTEITLGANLSFTGSALNTVTVPSFNSVIITGTTTSFPVASMGVSTGSGLVFIGKTGSSFDMELANGAGSAFLTNPTGTQNVSIPGSLVLGTALAVGQGGTGKTTVAAANQGLTPTTVVVTESAGAATVNWALGSSFFMTLNANCTVTFSGNQDGQVIVVTILNTASNWTVTWPSVKWTGGTAPTQTVGAKSDVYSFVYNSGTSSFYGSAVQNLS